MTIKNVYDHYVKSLSALYQKGEAEKIARLMMEDRLGVSETQIVLHSEDVISEVKANDLAWKLMRLLKGEPVQYVLGYTYFYGLRLRVNNSVLIPRPETEELVDWIVSEQRDEKEISILDIGTGSGCIAIALKKNLKGAEAYAMDISEKALHVAKENSELNNTEVNFFQGNILNSKFTIQNLQFAVIVSNPPYIPEKEKISLHKNITEFEPHIALFVRDNDPLLFYKAIVEFAVKNLEKKGRIYLEVNPDFADEISHLLLGAGFLNTQIKKDLSGHSRMVKGMR